MTTHTFYMGQDGKIPLGMKVTLSNIFPSYAGKKIKLSISESKEKRSLDQNAYWFGILDKHVVQPFRAAGSNWSNYKIHCHIMHELGYEDALVDPNGRVVASRLHSSEFNTAQWEEFMERARAYIASEYNIYLPLPNEDI